MHSGSRESGVRRPRPQSGKRLGETALPRGVQSADPDRIAYVADLIDELQGLARGMDLDVLERLLGLAHLEALRAIAAVSRDARQGRDGR